MKLLSVEAAALEVMVSHQHAIPLIAKSAQTFRDVRCACVAKQEIPDEEALSDQR